MSQEDSKKNVLIVGGSLAGLMNGIVLKRQGHHVTILERTPTSLLHNQGAGIVFGDEAQRFFSHHIRTSNDPSRRKELTVTSPRRVVLDKKGNVIHEEHHVQKMVSWDTLYFVLRANFDGLESEYCEVPDPQAGEGKGEYAYGNKVVGVRDVDGGVEAECETMNGEHKTLKGDLVIAADGPSSTVRGILEPDVKRSYAGYVAWRGTVAESEASAEVREGFVGKFSFFHDYERGIQILAYLIPGKAGEVEQGQRLINWVWYCNYPQDSEIYKDLMTDSEGHHHHFTLPVGKVQPRLIDQQKKYAGKVLAPQFAKLVQETHTPFVQAITDVISPRASFFNNKLWMVGDAVAGFRPHTAASTNQAAYHALLLERVMKGEMEWEEMHGPVMAYAKYMVEAGKTMGNRSQFSGRNR